jgi:segregation and condensation protein B
MDTDSKPADDHLSNVPGQAHTATVLESVTESLIFASDEPMSAKQIARVFSDVSGQDEPSADDIHSAVETINQIYALTDRSFRIEQWAGGFRMATTSDMMPYLKSFFKKNRLKKLSRSLMETAAILVYRQPATKADIEFVRGVDSDYALRKLLEFGLVDVVGRSPKIGRPLLYGTTDKFLELFGLNSVTDLPNLRELEEILDDPSFQKERAKMLMTSGIQMLDFPTGESSGPVQENPSTDATAEK